MKRINSNIVFLIYLVVLITSLGWMFIPNEPNIGGYVAQTTLAIVIFIYSIHLQKVECRTAITDIIKRIKNNK